MGDGGRHAKWVSCRSLPASSKLRPIYVGNHHNGLRAICATAGFPLVFQGVFEWAPAEPGLAPLPGRRPVLQDVDPLAAWVVALGCWAQEEPISGGRLAAGSWRAPLVLWSQVRNLRVGSHSAARPSAVPPVVRTCV